MSTENIPRKILVLTQRKKILGMTSRYIEKFCFIQPARARLKTRKEKVDNLSSCIMHKEVNRGCLECNTEN
jgi:hypothetical protein